MSADVRIRRQWIADHDPLPVRGHSTLGYDPRGTYAETYWLPLLGPTALWLLRRLVPAVIAAGPAGGVRVPLAALAGELGVGTSTKASGLLVSALDRLIIFRHAVVLDDVYRVNVAVPRLSEDQVDRLPPHLRAVHGGIGSVLVGPERPTTHEVAR